LEPLIGCFLNTLVLWTEIPKDASFTQILRKVREVTVDAYSHDDTPFEKVLETINPKRMDSRTPLFRVLVNMLALPDPIVVELPGVTVEIIDLPETSSKFDLTLYIYASNEKISFSLVYDADLFIPEMIGEMLQQFEYLLKQIINDPHARISQFSLVTPAAQSVLPNPRTILNSKWEGAVHELFRIQAGRNPHQLAVVDPYVQWSYAQIDQLSNLLANYLLSEYIQPGDVVAIYAHRSAPLVVALFGIMKAGAAFLVLDSAYPPARLVDYLETARPRALLQLESAGNLPHELNEWATASGCSKFVLPGSNKPEYDRTFENFPSAAPTINISADDVAVQTT
jgi:non-ribosomal peptide synthetase component F